MPRFDLTPTELEAYAPHFTEPADLDEFWARTLGEARSFGGGLELDRVSTEMNAVEVYDVRFPGFGGELVAGWLLRPAGTREALPTVVEFLGYGGGRGLPHERLAWATAGYNHLVMDTRGQGSGHGAGGITPDPHGSGPAVGGWMTRGILSPEDHFYRRVFADAVRAIDAVAAHPFVDDARIVVAGTSQGGGIAIAAAALSDHVAAALVDVPFLCHFDRAVGMTDRDPYGEVSRYLAVHRSHTEQVFQTLRYIDAAILAARATAPAVFSVALMDQTCPPSTVYAAFRRWAGPKTIEVYPFNDHEGGGALRWPAQARWVKGILPARTAGIPHGGHRD